MDINFLLNDTRIHRLNEDFQQLYSIVDPEQKTKIMALLKALRWTPEEADEFYQMEYGKEIEDYDHFLALLQAQLNGEDSPPIYEEPESEHWFNYKTLAPGPLSKLSEKKWKDIEKDMPEFITRAGFNQINTIIVTKRWLSYFGKLQKTSLWDRVCDALDYVIPALIAGKIDIKLYDMHFWKNDSSIIGIKLIGGRGTQVGMTSQKIDKNTIQLLKVEPGHGINDD